MQTLPGTMLFLSLGRLFLSGGLLLCRWITVVLGILGLVTILYPILVFLSFSLGLAVFLAGFFVTGNLPLFFAFIAHKP